jgi:hypothetical protein
MPSLRNEAARNSLIQRLHRLTPATRPRWGKLDAPRLLCHLADTLSMALSDIRIPSVNKKALQCFPLKHLILYVLPLPKNIPTAPELLFSPPTSFDADRRRAVELIERLATAPRALGAEHPSFGPLTNEEWNILQWKHTDHHLRQFGL